MRLERAVQGRSPSSFTRLLQRDRLGMSTRSSFCGSFTDNLVVQNHNGANRRARCDSAFHLFGKLERSVQWVSNYDTSRRTR